MDQCFEPARHPMSSPVSSRCVVSALDEALQCSVLVGVVGGVVLPAVPDDVDPRTGQDAYGVGVVVAAGDGAIVEVGGPGVGPSGVTGEVGNGVAQLFVARPAESNATDLAGLSGRGCHAGQTGQRFRCGEAGAAVTDLGKQSGGADAPGARQAGEDVGVGVQGQLFVDLNRQGFDLVGQAGKDSQICLGDAAFGSAVVSGGSSWRVGQAGVQDGGIGSAAVADAGQPGGQAFGREPVGTVLAVEAAQEAQADRAVDVGEQTDSTWKDTAQMLAQLVSQCDPMSDKVLAGAASAAQCDGSRTIGSQRTQAGTIGAQGIGEHEGIETIVFVAGRTVASAQVLDLVGADDHDGQATIEQGVDDRAIRAFDRDLADTMVGEQLQQGAQSSVAVFDGVSVDLLTSSIHDGQGVVIASPVDPSGQSVGRLVGQENWGTLHDSLLAAEPSGEAPDFRCQNVTAASLTDRRSLAHSPVDGRHALGTAGPRKTHAGRQQRQASRAMTQQPPRVHRRSIQDHRHTGWCTSNPFEKITDTPMVHQ